MANEILKDEILKDEQLENVAGGTHEETQADMDYLKRYCGVSFHGNWDQKVGKLGELYRRAGMFLDSSERHANKYTDGRGYSLSRNDALLRLGTAINNGQVDTNC